MSLALKPSFDFISLAGPDVSLFLLFLLEEELLAREDEDDELLRLEALSVFSGFLSPPQAV